MTTPVIITIDSNEDIATTPVTVLSKVPYTDMENKLVLIHVLDNNTKQRIYQKEVLVDDTNLPFNVIVKRGEEILLNTVIDTSTVFKEQDAVDGFMVAEITTRTDDMVKGYVYHDMVKTDDFQSQDLYRVKYESDDIIYLFQEIQVMIPYTAAILGATLTFMLQRISEDTLKMTLVKISTTKGFGEIVTVYEDAEHGLSDIAEEFNWTVSGTGISKGVFAKNQLKLMDTEHYSAKVTEVVFKDKHYLLKKNDIITTPASEE